MSEPVNREQRRHPDKVDDDGAGRVPEAPQSSEQSIMKQGNQEAQSVRAKSSGHGKKTADKWNQ